MYSRRSVLLTVSAGCTIAIAGCQDVLDNDDEGQDDFDVDTPELPEENGMVVDRAIDSYETGHEALQTADESVEEALAHWQDDSLSQADNSATLAIQSADIAVSSFENAADISRELDEAEAEQMANDASDTARLYENSVNHIDQGISAALDDENEAASSHVEQSMDFLDQAIESPLPSLSEFEDTFQ